MFSLRATGLDITSETPRPSDLYSGPVGVQRLGVRASLNGFSLKVACRYGFDGVNAVSSRVITLRGCFPYAASGKTFIRNKNEWGR